MTIRSGTFDTIEQVSLILTLRAGQTAEIIVTNTGGHAFEVDLEQELTGNQGTRKLLGITTNTASTLYLNDSPSDVGIRLRCVVVDKVPDADMIAYTLQDTIPTSAIALVCAAHAKAGTTSGWVVDAADNLGKLATLPASKTASTLVMRIPRLKVGDRIVGHHVVGSLQSAGGTTTLSCDLRSLTAAAAGATDASVAAMAAALSVTASVIVGRSNTEVKGFDHAMIEGETLYALITSTTAGSTTQEVQAVVINVIPAATFG